jgi:hypothetical protein
MMKKLLGFGLLALLLVVVFHCVEMVVHEWRLLLFRLTMTFGIVFAAGVSLWVFGYTRAGKR